MSVIRQIFQLFPEPAIDRPVLGCNLSQRVGVVVEVLAVEDADEVSQLSGDPSGVEAEGLHEFLNH